MNIEAGKCYKTRCGFKFTVYNTTARGDRPIHGCYHSPVADVAYTLMAGGRVGEHGQNDIDLVAPWVDEPTMDISALPAWAAYVLFTQTGWEWDYDGKICGGKIPKSFAPSQTVPPGSRYRIDRALGRLVLEEGGAK